ncbi:Dam family site-specific DNA-(adenine-N6)-methyltransferase [Orbaceae bacterium ac157xtp]
MLIKSNSSNKEHLYKKNRSFLKWAGGKFPMVEKIRNYLPSGEVLMEPFVGAGTIFLNTNYDRYVLADINHDLISLYEIVKNNPETFVEDAKLLFTEETNQEASFYQIRELFNISTEPYERALLFLYLNRHCFNGLCRYNTKGEFNVPFGRYEKAYFPEKEILFFAEKAQNAEFICAPYQDVMEIADPGYVVYCDPPYAPTSKRANFTAYYSVDFNIEDQGNLARMAEKLSNNQIPVIISNHDTSFTREWYGNADIFTVETRRSISCDGNGRKKIDELLALYLR